MSIETRVQVVRIAKCDAYYDLKDSLIGLKGVMKLDPYPKSAWASGRFVPDKVVGELRKYIVDQTYFLKVLVKKL